MNTKQITIQGLNIESVRKDIKNIHLGVYPPTGRVRVASPLTTSDESVKLFVLSKVTWIKKHMNNFLKQERESKREYISGESHYLFGGRYRLNVIEDSKPRIEIKKKTHIDLYVKPNTSFNTKERMFYNFYRAELNKIIPKLKTKWEKKIGIKVKEVKIKRMKTNWGTCNKKQGRIWINLELAKKPIETIEYVLIHEMVHMQERNHTSKFVELMNQYLPQWEKQKNLLNKTIIGYYNWVYSNGKNI